MRQLDIKITPLLPGNELNSEFMSVIKKHKPDFILVLMAWRLTKGNWERLKRVQNIPKIVWFTDDPYYMDWSRHTGKNFDIVFTNESRSLSVYRENGCQNVHHLPLGVDKSDFFPRPVVPKHFHSDVVVLGTAFKNRRLFIRHLLPHLSGIKLRLVGPGWEKLRSYSHKNVQIRSEWVSIKEANAYYNGAKIVLNLHRSPRDEYLRLNRKNVPAHTPNNRTFEVAACATLQLAEARSDLAALYPSSANIPTFRSPRECLKLLTYYLPRQQQRTKKAHDIYTYTLEHHQYKQRLQQLLNHLQIKNSE